VTNAEALNELGSAAILAMGVMGLLVLAGHPRREDAIRWIFTVGLFLTFAATLRFSCSSISSSESTAIM